MPACTLLHHATAESDNGVCVCVCQGTVIIVANAGSRIDIPDHSMLEDKVVTGDLRILEH